MNNSLVIEKFQFIPIDSALLKKALKITDILKKHQFIAYFAGGCVRDIVLNKPPKDIDIVSDAPSNVIQKLFKYQCKSVGREFGIELIVIDHTPFELAMFRGEGNYLDGRHPTSVFPATPYEDAQRRDFTLNGMFYDPYKHIIIDYVGGLKSIKKKEIKTIGDPKKRFTEDKLRMLRAIRFHLQTGFSLHQNILTTIYSMAKEIQILSKERIRQELVLIFHSQYREKGVQLLRQTQLWDFIFPNLMISKQYSFFFQFNQLEHILYSFFPSLTYQDIHQLTFLFCLKKEEIKALKNILWAKSKLLYFLDKPKELLIILMYKSQFLPQNFAFLETVAKIKLWDFFDIQYYNALKKLFEDKLDILKQSPLINGHDLIQSGLTPSPIFKEYLEHIELKRIQNQIYSKQQALEYIKKLRQ